MKTISLTKGQVALVDDCDFEILSQFKWYCSQNKTSQYATRRIRINGKQNTVYMHRVILGFPELHVDHIDGNGLNNQRSNLRTCTRSQNMMNQRLLKYSDTFKGVSQRTGSSKWRAVIKKNRRCYELGSFDNMVDAAKAYNEAAINLFGEFANLNTIPQQ